MRHSANSDRGFTLLELLFAATIGLLVVAGAVSLFTQALKATWITSQKGELQQDFRAAANLMQRDISMAGAGAMGQQGLAYNAIGLPIAADLGIGLFLGNYEADVLATAAETILGSFTS